MKVLIATGLFPPEIGGPATYSKTLLDELPKRGIEVEVLPFRDVRHLPKVLRHVAYFFKVLKKGRSVDIIFAQDPVSVGLPAALAAKVLGKRFLIKIVGDYAWEMEMQNEKRKVQSESQKFLSLEEFQKGKYDGVTEMRRKIERWVAKRAEMVIVPSNYLKGIVEMWGVPISKIKVIYNAFEVPDIKESKEEIRKRLNIRGTVLLSVGRLVPWKGFAFLMDRMKEIVKEIPEAHLYIAGDGPEEKSLKLKAKSEKLEENVTFLGRLGQQDLFSYIKAADIFVLNTGYEGFSHHLLEVAGIGTPIITTRIGGNPELIENEKTGLLVPYNNKEEIRKEVVRLIKDSDLRNTMVEEAKKKVLGFSIERMINELISLLK